MPENLVRLPITLNGNHERPVGFVMLEVYMVKELEMASDMWGIDFTVARSESGAIEQLRAINIYPHEMAEADAEEIEGADTNAG